MKPEDFSPNARRRRPLRGSVSACYNRHLIAHYGMHPEHYVRATLPAGFLAASASRSETRVYQT